jgi:hypothetical protein
MQMLVDRVAPGEHAAGNQNLVADFQRPDFVFGEGKIQFCHGLHFNPNQSESPANWSHGFMTRQKEWMASGTSVAVMRQGPLWSNHFEQLSFARHP